VKVAILAGGFGTRLAEETSVIPKPMVEIGGKPILWHIMKIYSHYGFKDFIIALGYRGEVIKKYMVDYLSLTSDLVIDMESKTIIRQNESGFEDNWKVELIDTGLNTLTGGRIKRLAPFLNETFMLTWGDGVADINLKKLYDFHRSHGKLATVTAVRPQARYGRLELDGHGAKVMRFSEKPQALEGWINGAFFVLEPEVMNYIGGDETQWENEPLEKLAADGQLIAYCHESFWQCMDTLREKHILQRYWESGSAPWKVWR
jgi:glucose-1-phosphate cytidylyltransferase